MTTEPVPAGYHTITPYLPVKGVRGFLDFLKKAFQAEEAQLTVGDDGTIYNAEIRGLLQDRHYPEAQTLANKLSGEPGVPDEIASEARDLSAQADQEMKNIFHKTTVKTKDEVVKKPPR